MPPLTDSPAGRITLHDLLSDDELGLTSVVPATDPRLVSVSWVHATEQFDPRPHLRKGELVCTLGSMLVNPEASRHFARTLRSAGVSVLGLGLGEIHGWPPPELVEACAQVSLPLIAVPHATPFLSINEAILRLREELQAAVRAEEARVLAGMLASARIGQMFELIERGLAHPAALASEMQGGKDWRGIVQVTAWPSGSEEAIRHYRPDGLIGTTTSFVIMVATPRPESELRQLGLSCGFSSEVDVINLRRGLSEARSALRTARTRADIAGPADLVSLESLLEQTSSEALLRFAEQLYDPLVRSDLERRTELVATLRDYLENGQHLQRTAARLYVHVNTVRHRLQRIAELTDRDPLTHSGLTDLRVAMWANDRRRNMGVQPHRPTGL